MRKKSPFSPFPFQKGNLLVILEMSEQYVTAMQWLRKKKNLDFVLPMGTESNLLRPESSTWEMNNQLKLN